MRILLPLDPQHAGMPIVSAFQQLASLPGHHPVPVLMIAFQSARIKMAMD